MGKKELKEAKRARKAAKAKARVRYNRWYRRLFRWLKGLFN